MLAYDEAALSNLWRVAKTTMDPQGRAYTNEDEFVDEGIGHVAWVAAAADRLADALAEDPWGLDPCSVAGEGWRAREAVAVAVGILDGFSDIPLHEHLAEEFLVRAAETNGDSDSIGAILGALVGAAYGDIFPREWIFRLETRYRTELSTIAARIKD